MNQDQKIATLEKELEWFKNDLEDFRFYFEEFSNFLPLPYLSTNPLGVILDTNKSFEELTQVPKTEAIGKEAVDFFGDQEKLHRLERTVLTGQMVRGEEMVLKTSQKEIFVSVHLSPRRDRDGEMIGYFLGIFDITEFKRLQQNLEQKVEERTHELKDRVEELERFYRLTVGRELKMIELKKEIRSTQSKNKTAVEAPPPV